MRECYNQDSVADWMQTGLLILMDQMEMFIIF